MPNRMATLTVCALLGGGACAEDRAPLAPDPRHHGSIRTGTPNAGVISASRGAEPMHGESKANTSAPDPLVYGPSNIQWGATELLVIRKLSGSTGDAAAGPRPAAGRTAFLLQQEHDVAIRLINTGLALRFKLSADGVHLNLAF